MNTEKEKTQRMIEQNLQSYDFLNKGIVKIKDDHRGVLAIIETQRDTYQPDVIVAKIEKEKQNYQGKMQAAHEGIEKRLDELRSLINDRDKKLDLSNPDLNNALELIKLINPGIENIEKNHELAKQINSNFFDQPSRRALLMAYQAQGASTAGLEAQVYNADKTIDNLKKLAYQALIQDGSLNTFANDVSKLAVIEGINIEKMPDQAGFEDAIRAGAGLPAVVPEQK